jgi:RNA polymerase sigma factor (sigma-70 family)
MTLPPFQAFLDDHRQDVYRFLVTAVGPDEADDCFQDTFLSALRAYPRVDEDSNLRAWIFTIAHRKTIDAHRARRRRPTPSETVPETAAPAPPANDEGAVWTAVGELPEKQRSALLHRFVNDLEYADVGRIIGCSEEAARRNVHEGLKKLRGAWAT